MKRKVAIYARVSTEHEAQISALENQVQYYDEILNKQPDWELYERYVDEGITGTSVNKRESFLRMMEDAKSRKFDLVITREVSRFARNIVDTLQQTRILKTYGVEVWFTEDNIWTMNDEDGELRLSIMATLAQNESKKISSRVKAGQKISFMNGVLYGNGNILGYDRDGKELVINKEQADTVRHIFDLYLQGNGSRKIQFTLEQEGRKTALGKTNWSASVILRILKNPFYCGRIEYRKQYVPDYLTQKKINNKGEVERITVKGKHQPIVTEEEFDKVQEMLKSSIVKKNDGKTYGKPLADNVWVRKVKCKCGHTMNRRINYVSKTTGNKTYTFQCYDQLHTGSIATRTKKGLSTDGICDNKSFPQWKLEVQADFIFRNLLLNKQEIYDTAMMMIDDSIIENNSSEKLLKDIEKNISEIDKFKMRIDNLLDMCTDGDISRETFRTKRDTIEEKIVELENKNKIIQQQIKDSKNQNDKFKRIEVLSEFLKMNVFRKEEPIPDTIIEKYVQDIVVDKDNFIWRLHPDIGNVANLLFDGASLLKSNRFSNKSMYDVQCCTGCNQHETLIETPIFIGTFNIPKNYMKSIIGFYYDNSDFRFPKEMEIQLELI